MFTGWRKSNNPEPEEEILRNAEIRKRLINELSIGIKELQKSYIESDFEVDRNDEQAQMICTLLEAIFLHGYQGHGSKFSNFYNLLGKISTEGSIPTHSFWEFLVIFTHRDIVNELEHLTHISTDVGRSRAWIRLALNDGLMESYLDAILSDNAKIQQYYKSSSFLMDSELPFIMISFLQGLVEYKFDFNYNTTSLNTWTGDTLTLSGIWQLPRVARPSLTASSVHAMNSPSAIPVTIPAQVRRSHVTPGRVSAQQLAVSLASEPEVGEFVRSIEDSTEYGAVGLQNIRNSPVEITPVAVSQPLVVQQLDEEDSSKTHEVSAESLEAGSGQGADLISNQVDSRDAPVTTSPTPLIGSNKLGVTCGWSSSFDAESQDTVDHGERHQVGAEMPSPVTDASKTSLPKSPVRKPPSFTTLLSDYTVQGPSRFDGPSYGNSSSNRTHSTPKQIAQARSPATPMDVAPSGFEVVPPSSSVHSEHADERVQYLMGIVTDISNEKGLDSQNYQCRGCGRNIGMIYGEAKVCIYDACYYCYECHVDEEHVIPARVIHNWDFRKHRVARHTKLFLLQIEEDPLFNVDETNPTLYNVITELHEVKMLRIQLQHLKGFLFTCKQPIADEIRRRIWPREYLWDDIHQYSLLDLVQVQSGQLAHHLKKIISHCTKHVYRCKLCCQKGFICEICNNPKIIYPFEIKTTSQCGNCRAVYHKPCITDNKCPKCVRKRRQHAATELSVKSGLEFDAPW